MYVRTSGVYVPRPLVYSESNACTSKTCDEYAQTRREYMKTPREYVQTRREYMKTSREYVQTRREYVQGAPSEHAKSKHCARRAKHCAESERRARCWHERRSVNSYTYAGLSECDRI